MPVREGQDARGCSASRLRSRHVWERVTRGDEREGLGAGVGGGVGVRVSSLRFPRVTDGTLGCVILIDHLEYEAPVESGSCARYATLRQLSAKYIKKRESYNANLLSFSAMVLFRLSRGTSIP